LKPLVSHRPLLALVALAGAAGAAGAACNAVVGNDDIQFVPDTNGSDASDDLAEESAPPGQDAGADALPSDACTADVQGDPANCGACGRDCKGQPCLSGACQPEVLVTGLRDPRRIAANPSSLFVSEYGDTVNLGAIGTCAKSGCSTTTYQRIAPSQRLANDLILNASVLYWTVQNNIAGVIEDCAAGGCDAGGFLAVLAPNSLIAGENELFWLSFSQIQACPLSGCVSPAVVANLGDSPSGLAYFDGGLVWPATADAGAAFAIRACSPAKCAATAVALVTRQSKPRRVYMDDTGLYWLEDGALLSCALGAPCPTPRTLTTGFSGGVDLAVAGGNVYWSATTPGAIMKCPSAGCFVPQVLARDINVGDLVVDTDFVYWVSGGPVPPDAGGPNGRISRTPR
jgi:hypothetical protein